MNRDLQSHTEIITALLDRDREGDQRHGGVLDNIRERSSGFATTEKDEKDYFEIQLREAFLRRTIAQRIVNSLQYENISERYEGVSEAHKKTFEWIFEPRDEKSDLDRPYWSDFVKWLREGDGIYWINGKAGSGKSTLMKYIYDNPKTQEHLQVWAGQTPLHIARFFFWWRGTAIQKSQDGLLRSLLHDVLHQMPELIPYVLPSQWAAQYAAETSRTKLRPVRMNRLPSRLLH